MMEEDQSYAWPLTVTAKWHFYVQVLALWIPDFGQSNIFTSSLEMYYPLMFFSQLVMHYKGCKLF